MDYADAKILQNHLLCAFVGNLKIDAIYALYPKSFCDKNLAIRKVFAFCDSDAHTLKSIEWSPQTQHLKIFAACPYLETRAPGLHKLWNPAIPDGRPRSKFGEHGKDGKHQPHDLKHSMNKYNSFMI